ncbi:Ger(x)C family spore germination protein [Paenibacillus solisilvae]|uniref:Ger(X)C family spore germination protein n=1 Tax=Paenibacillus solisilvae TaxID=2486751 RepID=A0ABW0VTS6_9BACL
MPGKENIVMKLLHLPRTLLLLVIPALLLSACGDRSELPERAFVMGVGIDESENGKVLLTFQVYKPSQSVAAKGKVGNPYINVKTTDDSVMEAVRDVTIHLGRKAQFSHMRVILISEKIARKIQISKLLDMFYRDHEPRLTSSVIITKGSASQFFDYHPFIESTISQQYFLSEKSAARYSAKSEEINLLTLALQLRSQTGIAVLPYLTTSPVETGKEPSVAGLAVLKNGLMVDKLTSYESEGLLMLTKTYHSGIIQLPCPSEGNEEASILKESLEVVRLKSERAIKLQDDRVTVNYRVHASVAAIDLPCTTMNNSAEESAYEKRIAQEVKKQMKAAIAHLRKDKADLLDIGNDIYKYHPAKWRKWKPDWPEMFPEIEFHFDVEALMITHGTTAGKSLLETKSD